MYSCFSLFVVLFIPEPDYEDAPVGEELMEWLNIHFIEPSTEEGDQLSTLDRPWEDANFWSYLTRYIVVSILVPHLIPGQSDDSGSHEGVNVLL